MSTMTSTSFHRFWNPATDRLHSSTIPTTTAGSMASRSLHGELSGGTIHLNRYVGWAGQNLYQSRRTPTGTRCWSEKGRRSIFPAPPLNRRRSPNSCGTLLRRRHESKPRVFVSVLDNLHLDDRRRDPRACEAW